jgi:hypothetical protein
MKRLNKPYTSQEYVELASYCNENNLKIEDKGSFLETVENKNILPEYILNRMETYPNISEQLDMLYWDKVNGTNKWQEMITNIKNKYPKA